MDPQRSIVFGYFELTSFFVEEEPFLFKKKNDTYLPIIVCTQEDMDAYKAGSTFLEAHKMSNITYDDGRVGGAFLIGLTVIPTVKQGTYYRSTKKYLIKEESVPPFSREFRRGDHFYVIVTDSPGKTMHYAFNKTGLLFYALNIKPGRLVIDKINYKFFSGSGRWSMKGSFQLNEPIVLDIKTPGAYSIGAYRLTNPGPPIIDNAYSFPEKKGVRLDALGHPDEIEQLNFLLEKAKGSEWESIIRAKLAGR